MEKGPHELTNSRNSRKGRNHDNGPEDFYDNVNKAWAKAGKALRGEDTDNDQDIE